MTIDDAIAAYETGGTVANAQVAREEVGKVAYRADEVLRAATREPLSTIQKYVRSRLGRRGLTGVEVQCRALVHRYNRPPALLVTVSIPLRGPGRLVDQWTSDRVETLAEWCVRIGKIGADLMKQPERRSDA